jgi:hypothetical protein
LLAGLGRVPLQERNKCPVSAQRFLEHYVIIRQV